MIGTTPVAEGHTLTIEQAAEVLQCDTDTAAVRFNSGQPANPSSPRRPFTSAASPARHRGAFGHHPRGRQLDPPILDSFGCSQRIVH